MIERPRTTVPARWLPAGAAIALLAVILYSGFVGSGSVRAGTDLEAGRFLVAKPDLLDPNFIHTVILLVDYSEEGAMGLIVNRPSKVPLARVFPDFPQLKGQENPVYIGGPVAPSGVLALYRSARKPADAKRVMGDIYLISTAEALEAAVASGAGADRLRVFSGYAGWGAGQLDFEVARDSWFVFKSDPTSVFDPEPGTLWERFIKRTEQIFARWRRGGLSRTRTAAGPA